jgi:hypothetical protein
LAWLLFLSRPEVAEALEIVELLGGRRILCDILDDRVRYGAAGFDCFLCWMLEPLAEPESLV